MSFPFTYQTSLLNHHLMPVRARKATSQIICSLKFVPFEHQDTGKCCGGRGGGKKVENTHFFTVQSLYCHELVLQNTHVGRITSSRHKPTLYLHYIQIRLRNSKTKHKNRPRHQLVASAQAGISQVFRQVSLLPTEGAVHAKTILNLLHPRDTLNIIRRLAQQR